MDKIICPVCGTEIPVGGYCSTCGFEPPLFSEIPSDKVQKIERERIELAKQLWGELQEARNKGPETMSPVGYLVTERFVVYCIYEGYNTFGSSLSKVEEHHQKVIIPNCSLRKIHFSITATKGEKGCIFTLNEVDGTTPTVFVNSLTEPLSQDFQLSDDDDIIISPKENETFNIKFRKQL